MSEKLSPLTPQSAGGLALKHTNVSTPSVIEHKPSQQSITASEDYYSLSSNVSQDTIQDPRALSANPLHALDTPPSRYRTPLVSRDDLPQQSQSQPQPQPQQQRQNVPEEEGVEVRKTPMRGHGKRRASVGEAVATQQNPAMATAYSSTAPFSRPPAPPTGMERQDSWPPSEGLIDPTPAQSSVARDISREQDAPTPGLDDTPVIRFALEQLTRDEDVRGSRRYRGVDADALNNYPPVRPEPRPLEPNIISAQPQQQRDDGPSLANMRDVDDGLQQEPAIPGAWPQPQPRLQQQSQQPSEALLNAPPPRNPARLNTPPLQPQRKPFGEPPDVFLPVASEGTQHPPLHFRPGILRLPQLLLFLIFLLVLLTLLLLAAIWSLVHPGIADYGTFGDGTYFVFQYLPTLLGMVLFLWLLQIEIAVFRIAPFMAMSNTLSLRVREAGAELSMYPRGFVLPYFGHWTSRQPVVAFFMLTAWLQIWTLPFLGSSFNVHFYGDPETGMWMWVATQGAIWTVIILYILLFTSVAALALYLTGRTTGLLWDPRSLADLVVLLARSNALTDNWDIENGIAPKLGYWRLSGRPNEVFHTYGIVDRAPRSYEVEDGRIREKPFPSSSAQQAQRLSDPMASADAGSMRHSREKMLPRDEEANDPSSSLGFGLLMPWFLRPTFALLWPIIAVVLLLAFLIVSYLPSTRVSQGFNPDVPAPVDSNGFSGTNFLWSFIPGLLATLLFLCWLDIDYAYRRLQPYISLASAYHGQDAVGDAAGELAEHSLLLSYPSTWPLLTTLSALSSSHYRVALLSFTTLLAATLPILAGGVFWAQFYVPQQKVLISAHMPAYYALTVLVTLLALAFLAIYPPPALRHASATLPHNAALSFRDARYLVRQSRLLDDLAFHSPASKTDLVTRLLSAVPGAPAAPAIADPKAAPGRLAVHADPAATASKVSLADSVRGLARARQRAVESNGGAAAFEVPRYALGRFVGRAGTEAVMVDRVGRRL